MARNKAIDLTLPTTVSALGVQFQVKVVDVVDDEGSLGETAGELRIIKVASSQDTRRRWTTFALHEYLHAVLDVNGVGSVLDEGIEEIIVQSMEHALEQLLLKHGPQLLAALAVQQGDDDV